MSIQNEVCFLIGLETGMYYLRGMKEQSQQLKCQMLDLTLADEELTFVKTEWLFAAHPDDMQWANEKTKDVCRTRIRIFLGIFLGFTKKKQKLLNLFQN